MSAIDPPKTILAFLSAGTAASVRGARVLVAGPRKNAVYKYTHPYLTRLWYHWTYRVERVCSLRVSDRCSLVLIKKSQSHMLWWVRLLQTSLPHRK